MSNTRPSKTAKPKAKSPTKPKGKPRAQPVAELDLGAAAAHAARILVPTAPPAKASVKTMSGLDAAALVLKEAGEPLNVQALIVRILERGLWKTEGRTPAATIYAAMIREIKAKGSSSRFQKVDRGTFTAG
jgi:hypothetical protein